MNSDKDYEYYSTRAQTIPPKAKGVLWTRRIKLSLQDAHLPYYESVINHRRLHQYRKSIVQLRKLVILKPDSLQGWQDLGRSLFAAGKYDKSLEIFKKTLQMSPGSKAAHQDLIKAIDKSGRWEEIASIYEDIGDYLHSWKTKEYFETGIEELVKRKKNKYAIECYKKAFEVHRLDVYHTFREGYAKLLHKEGFLQEALTQYELARKSPNYAGYCFERPFLKYDLMMVEEAVEDMKGFLKLQYKPSFFYFELAVMVYHLHESVEMIEPYKKEVENYLRSYYNSHTKQELLKETRAKLENETDEKVKGSLVKKIKALEFVLNWAI